MKEKNNEIRKAITEYPKSIYDLFFREIIKYNDRLSNRDVHELSSLFSIIKYSPVFYSLFILDKCDCFEESYCTSYY